MNAALVLGAVLHAVAAQQPPSSALAPAAKIIVLPVRMAAGVSSEHRHVARALELLLGQALTRHSGQQVVTQAEVGAMLGTAAADQLNGCDAEACLAEAADAMGAQQALVTRVDVAPGLWLLQASIVNRAAAEVVRRAQIRARSLGSLLDSVDLLARQLCSGARLVADAPDLAERLGTPPAGAEELRTALAQNPQADAVTAWTDLMVTHNRESETLAFAQGALALAGGALVFVATVAHGLVQTVHVLRPAPDHSPVLTLVPGLLLPALALLGLGMVAGALVALTAWDLSDVGRIPVRLTGCCRQEDRVRAAAAPGWGRKAGPMLALAGAAVALISPLGAVAALVSVWALALLGLTSRYPLPGPSLADDNRAFRSLMTASGLVMGMLVLAAAVMGQVTMGLLLRSMHGPLVDESPLSEVTAPPAADPSQPRAAPSSGNQQG